MVGELALCDMTHDADMRRGGLDVDDGHHERTGYRHPGGAQQGRELAGLAAEHVDDGCEFFGEQEESGSVAGC